MSYMATLRRDLAKLEHEGKETLKEAFKTKHLIISFFLGFLFCFVFVFSHFRGNLGLN